MHIPDNLIVIKVEVDHIVKKLVLPLQIDPWYSSEKAILDHI